MQDRSIAAHEGATGRFLIGIPVLVASSLGLALAASRFFIALGENLKDPPEDWKPILIFIVITGSAALLIVMASALVGLLIGLALKAVIRGRAAAGRRRVASASGGPA
jgi:predicted benzoate:H+ symporter BenE